MVMIHIGKKMMRIEKLTEEMRVLQIQNGSAASFVVGCDMLIRKNDNLFLNG